MYGLRIHRIGPRTFPLLSFNSFPSLIIVTSKSGSSLKYHFLDLGIGRLSVTISRMKITEVLNNCSERVLVFQTLPLPLPAASNLSVLLCSHVASRRIRRLLLIIIIIIPLYITRTRPAGAVLLQVATNQ